MKFKLLLFLAFFAGISVRSCNKTIEYSDLYVSDGFINVSVSGTTIRDSVVNMSFLADKYAKSDMSTASIYIPVDRDQDYYTFKVFRSEDYTKSKYFKFQITVIGDSLVDATLTTYILDQFEDNRYMELSLNTTSRNKSFSDLNFDEDTRTLSGNFEYVPNIHREMIVSGNFEVTLNEIVPFK